MGDRRVGVDVDAFYLLGEPAIRVAGQLDYEGWQADPLTQGGSPDAVVALEWRRVDGTPLAPCGLSMKPWRARRQLRVHGASSGILVVLRPPQAPFSQRQGVRRQLWHPCRPTAR